MKELNWTPPFPALRKSEFPRFHQVLIKGGRDDLSFKIDSCCKDSIRLDCEQVPEHDGTIPVRCNRRICPGCARKDMGERIDRYRSIAHITYPSSKDQEKLGYRLRYWTFTQTARPGQELRKPVYALKNSLFRWWRYVYGNRQKANFSDVGGLFCIEVGEGWNAHAHALIFGPYHGYPGKPSRDPVPQLEECRQIWIDSTKYYSWYGERIHIEEVKDPESSIIELISYPLNPEKRNNFDERLLAHIELAFSGRNSISERPDIKPIPAIRRYFAKGSWYNRFEKKEHHIFCPDCLKHGSIWQMVREPSYDCFKGRHFQKNHFDSEEKWENRLQYINPTPR